MVAASERDARARRKTILAAAADGATTRTIPPPLAPSVAIASRSRSTNGAAANLARKKIVKAAKSELSPLVQDMSLFCSAKEAS